MSRSLNCPPSPGRGLDSEGKNEWPLVGSTFAASQELIKLLSQERAGLATDYDGTLSQITVRRSQAIPVKGVRETLQRLVRRLSVVAVISGRPALEVASFLEIPEVTYVGNHGAEWLIKGRLHLSPISDGAQAEIETARRVLAAAVSGMEGVELETKRAGLALHYRQAAHPGSTELLLLRLVSQLRSPRLRILKGRKVIEMVAAENWNKGSALLELAKGHALQALAYFGDDLADIAAFQMLRRLKAAGRLRTYSVAVLSPESSPEIAASADGRLDDPEAVARILRRAASGIGASSVTGP